MSYHIATLINIC
uniref:Uncharacterized protein n=1 Tax=Lepeophtheirus salmonis TaxID=72036 RepID=A0A0K2VFU9_LEPSM